MKQFIKSFVVSVLIYSIYVVSLSYFGASFYVGANAGWLVVIYPLIVVILLGSYLWFLKKVPRAAAGMLCGVLLCLAGLQILLS